MAALHLLRRGVMFGLAGVFGVVMASCAGPTNHRRSSSTKETAVKVPMNTVPPPALTTALAAFATTPVRMSIAVSELTSGVDRRLTVYAAWDPIDRDGEVATIGANAGVESGYGASRIVNGQAWSLIAGHWYRVGFGQQVIGKVVAVVGVIRLIGQVHAVASQVINGTTCLGFAGSLSQGQLLAIEHHHGRATLMQALAGIDRLGYTVYVGGPFVRGLDITAIVSGHRVRYRTQWRLTFPSWGTPVQIQPPVRASVLPGSAPAGGLLPL